MKGALIGLLVFAFTHLACTIAAISAGEVPRLEPPSDRSLLTRHPRLSGSLAGQLLTAVGVGGLVGALRNGGLGIVLQAVDAATLLAHVTRGLEGLQQRALENKKN